MPWKSPWFTSLSDPVSLLLVLPVLMFCIYVGLAVFLWWLSLHLV
jgi:hypothetical protein